MSKLEKAKERIRSKPKDYTYNEAKYLLSQLGFKEYNKGKTSGSIRKLYCYTNRIPEILCPVVLL